MELSGNVWERAVATFTASGRAYTGTHGDGTLNSGGDFNVVGWSGMYANFIGYRGGHFGGDWTLNMVSDRKYGSIDFDSREAGNGGRGVRTAPVADPPGAHTLEETESPRWAGGAYDGWAEARQDGFSDMRLNAGTILCVW